MVFRQQGGAVSSTASPTSSYKFEGWYKGGSKITATSGDTYVSGSTLNVVKKATTVGSYEARFATIARDRTLRIYSGGWYKGKLEVFTTDGGWSLTITDFKKNEERVSTIPAEHAGKTFHVRWYFSDGPKGKNAWATFNDFQNGWQMIKKVSIGNSSRTAEFEFSLTPEQQYRAGELVIDNDC